MRLAKRLSKLEAKPASPGRIEVWLYDLDGKSVAGPDSKRYTVQEAERMQEGVGVVIDLRHRER